MANLLEVSEVLAGAMPPYAGRGGFRVPAGQDADFFFRTWHRYVGHLEAKALQAALDRAVINSPDFFPTPGHVLQAAAQIETGSQLTGLEAWGKVKFAMRVYGNWHPPRPGPYPLQINNHEWEFEDPNIAEAVRAIGWLNLFEGHEDTMRAHFIRAYETMCLRELSRRTALPAPVSAPQLEG